MAEAPPPAAAGRITADWIAVDWGTSSLRLWAMGPCGPVAEAASAEGMAGLPRDGFEPALTRLAAGWLGTAPVEVMICGMAGSRQGWHEAPYRTVPCAPVDPATPVAVPAADRRLRVRIVPGLKQLRPAADVMRGEETQIAGALVLRPGFDGVLCLPGTHAKWARVSAGEVTSFQTFLTGELFALLSRQSVLRHGMQGEGEDPAAFDAAVADALSHPERFGARLFGLRAEGLIAGLAPASARARLSGLLIGLELAGSRPYWLGERVVLVGAPALAALYARALAAQGGTPETLAATEATLAGLAFARGPA
jgi:2-dehydro-3-deoxygalactonokinase